ncbi:hypothetical protein RclHR1_00720031 [Rhizophagus clarus]|uniref:MIR domain-containing protein n=1 Tax=Rhizophagus clarus TaxID=94130 RepID=A0A2Z6SC97_9GLOM|nr:hypothetical protein RclHR1_00720031 [Rhizophagus clarus]GES94895.1 hypothetical protein GLOIN_2v1494576 [Rhizophagus clarus]
MDLPKYDGNIHPEEWMKQIQTHCYLKGIESEIQILKICKLMIDFTIIIPKEINSFDKLIKTLKSHTTFSIFKNSCKKKLQLMKYNPEEEDIVSFLTKFRLLCNYAEINDPEELKTLLVNSYSNDFFKKEFIKRIDNNINSKEIPYYIDEIIKLFSEVVLDELKVIKYDSLIALKHVTTGRYLSSCDINYQTGSQKQIVFAGEKFCNSQSIWFLTKSQSDSLYQQNMVSYNDKFYLKHKGTISIFGLSYHYKSPKTGQSEAFCNNKIYSNSNCQFVKLNNNALYVNSKDTINLKIIGSQPDLYLRSHDFTFTINNEALQEVVGHSDRIGANDEWCIELVE